MYSLQRGDDVVVNLGGGGPDATAPRPSPKAAAPLWSTRLFGRFRRFFMCFVFSLRTSPPATPRGAPHDEYLDEVPKWSCSSYRYSSSSHYHEAIEDCIEFFNRSAQEGMPGGQSTSDILLV